MSISTPEVECLRLSYQNEAPKRFYSRANKALHSDLSALSTDVAQSLDVNVQTISK